MITYQYESRELHDPIDDVVFQKERLENILQSSNHIRREDRELLLQALEIILELRNNKY